MHRDGEIVSVDVSDGRRVVGNEIMVAVGRRPRTDELGLDTVGLEPGKEVSVDDELHVPGLRWLYAIGDVNGRSLVTHMGKYQARVVSQAIAGRHARATRDTRPATRDDGAAPRVVFTAPQLAAVGLTLNRAQDAGMHAHAYDVPSSATAGASFHGGDTPGTSHLVVDEDRGVVVGATFTGTDVAEWLHAATIAIVGETPVERLWQAVPAFPTRNEVWLKREVDRVRRPAAD